MAREETAAEKDVIELLKSYNIGYHNSGRKIIEILNFFNRRKRYGVSYCNINILAETLDDLEEYYDMGYTILKFFENSKVKIITTDLTCAEIKGYFKLKAFL